MQPFVTNNKIEILKLKNPGCFNRGFYYGGFIAKIILLLYKAYFFPIR